MKTKQKKKEFPNTIRSGNTGALAFDTASTLLIRAFVPTISGINLFLFAADSFIFGPQFLIMTDLTRWRCPEDPSDPPKEARHFPSAATSAKPKSVYLEISRPQNLAVLCFCHFSRRNHEEPDHAGLRGNPDVRRIH